MHGKYSVLRPDETVFVGDADHSEPLVEFLEVVAAGRIKVGALAAGAHATLSKHWDTIARVCQNPKRYRLSMGKAYAQANLLLTRQEALGLKFLDLEAQVESLESTSVLREQSLLVVAQQLVEKAQALQASEARLEEQAQALQASETSLAERAQAAESLESQLGEKTRAQQELLSELDEKSRSLTPAGSRAGRERCGGPTTSSDPGGQRSRGTDQAQRQP